MWLYSETYGTESADAVVVDKSRQSPAITMVSRQSDSTAWPIGADQIKAASTGSQTDVAVKRKQIGLKRKSLQEMRHLLNTAAIAVFASVSFNNFLEL